MSASIFDQRLNTLDIVSYNERNKRVHSEGKPFSATRAFNLSPEIVTKVETLPLRSIDIAWIEEQKQMQTLPVSMRRIFPEIDGQNRSRLSIAVEITAKNVPLFPSAIAVLKEAGVDLEFVRQFHKESMQKLAHQDNWTDYAKSTVELVSLFPDEIGFIDKSTAAKEKIILDIQNKMTDTANYNPLLAPSVLEYVGYFELLFPGEGETLMRKHIGFWEDVLNSAKTISYYSGEIATYKRLKLAAPKLFAERVSQVTIDELLGEPLIQEIATHHRNYRTTILHNVIYDASVLYADTISLTSRGFIFEKFPQQQGSQPLPERRMF